ncbi:MAG: hypothetical protein FJ271_32045 [Planctomycetes bacterium]|nr:hypothetical protein [Planctomycetota bacterium]
MRIAIECLQPGADIGKRLQRDGWAVEQVDDRLLLADHPGVSSESAARIRLHQVGLLTSGRLRIHFNPAPVGAEA